MSHVHWNEVRKGIPVYFCSKHGKKKCRNMKIKNKNGEYRLIVARKRDQMQRSSKKTSIALQDIGEIRPGLNSIAFKQNPDVFNQSLVRRISLYKKLIWTFSRVQSLVVNTQ